ncbi:hypothetical protein BDZ97DRAFT_1808023 [Flammula alnicola]|nr:hypothetical protein BDZ97DRAFT_1808023 [Flammula alnicola]
MEKINTNQAASASDLPDIDTFQMPLLSLPTDVLSQIFRHCNPVASITETCCEFAVVAQSTPSLWCEIYVGPRQFVFDGPDLLRSRLRRAGILPLKVSIASAGPEVNKTIVSDICVVLSEHNAHIKRMEIDTQTALEAGNFLSSIYPSLLATFPELRTLSVRVEDDPAGYSPTWPQLDIFLQRVMPSFPNLQTVAIPTHFPCIPVFKTGTESFSRLNTLIFDGAIEEEDPSMALVVGLLHHTPQLETLWLKTLTRETSVTLSPTIPATTKNTDNIPVPVTLLRLCHLAITTPGAGPGLLLCIEAPALRNLHLDGSRGPLYRERAGEDIFWTQNEANAVQMAMKRLARGSPDLRHLAITATYLTEESWRWLLLGNGSEGPPFRHLESLALHELESLSGEVPCGFNDALLLQYSVQSNVVLQRLSLRRCTLPVNGSALLHVFTNAIERDPTTSYRLKIDSSCTGVTEDHIKALAAVGVIVINHRVDEVEEHEWWFQGHQIDASDSHVY